MKKRMAIFLASRRCFSLVVLFMLTQFSNNGYAQYLSGPVALSLGGAGRGAADEAEQGYLNPATIVHASTFTSALLYADGYLEKNEHESLLAASVTDNSEEIMFAGGYAYSRRRRTFDQLPSLEEEYHQIAVGKFVAKHLSLGMTVMYLKSKIIEDKTYNQVDGHLGLHYNPDPNFGVGLVTYNLGPRDRDIPFAIQNLDKIGVGVHYLIQPQFRLRGDVIEQLQENPQHRRQYQLGFESQTSQFFMARIGLDKDDLNKQKIYSFGLGFDGPRLKIDYSYRKNSEYHAGAMHGVDLRLPFW